VLEGSIDITLGAERIGSAKAIAWPCSSTAQTMFHNPTGTGALRRVIASEASSR